MSNIISLAFSGPGAVIPQMLGIGVASWIVKSVLTTIGKGQIAGMVDVASVLLCVTLVINCVANVLGKII